MAKSTVESTRNSATSSSERPVPLTRWWVTAWQAVRQPSLLHRDALLLMTSTIIGSLSGFFYWKAVTWLYPSTSVGIAAVALSSATFLAGMATLGLTTGMIRFLPQAAPREKAALFTFAHLVSAGAGVVAVLIFLGGRQWWAPDFILSQTALLYSIVFFALVLVQAHTNIHLSVLQAERQTPLLALSNLGAALAQLILVFILPVSFGPLSIVMTVLLPKVIVAILLSWVISKHICAPIITFHIGTVPFGSVMMYSLGTHIFNLLWSLPDFLFPLLILNYLGPTANAHLAVTWLINKSMLIIPNSVAVALLIDGSHKEEQLGPQARIAVLTDMALLTPVVLAVTALAPFILGIFGADYAHEAAGLLRLLSFASLPISVTSVYLTVKRVRKQIVSLNLLALALSGLGIVSSFVLVTRLGIIGIGWGWLLSQSIFALFLVGPLWREQHRRRQTTEVIQS